MQFNQYNNSKKHAWRQENDGKKAAEIFPLNAAQRKTLELINAKASFFSSVTLEHSEEDNNLKCVPMIFPLHLLTHYSCEPQKTCYSFTLRHFVKASGKTTFDQNLMVFKWWLTLDGLSPLHEQAHYLSTIPKDVIGEKLWPTFLAVFNCQLLVTQEIQNKSMASIAQTEKAKPITEDDLFNAASKYYEAFTGKALEDEKKEPLQLEQPEPVAQSKTNINAKRAADMDSDELAELIELREVLRKKKEKSQVGKALFSGNEGNLVDDGESVYEVEKEEKTPAKNLLKRLKRDN